MPRPSRINSGDRFGRLSAIDRVRSDDGLLLWRFQCDCGAEVISNGQPMLRKGVGRWLSCGCYRRETLRGSTHPLHRHGKRGSRVYRIWNAMKQRCHNPNQPHYERYGGRGVFVCQAWRDSFEAFFEAMGEPPSDKHSIDRIDPNGGYEPGNCRWATASQQNRNKRPKEPTPWLTQCSPSR